MRLSAVTGTFTPLTLAAYLGLLQGCASPQVPIPDYIEQADGAKAAVVRTWNVTVNQGPPIGLASGGSICNGYLYLSDPRQSLVHEISLDDGVRRRMFSLAEIEGQTGNPETVVADCMGNALFVADQHGVARFDLTSGAYKSRLPKPERVGPALGTSLLSGSSVILSAYTMPDRGSWLTRRPSAALSDGAIGYRVPLDGSAGEPVLTELLNEGCRAMSFDCLRLGLDRLGDGTSGWLACQSDGREVGIYSDAGALISRIDVRSPGFLDDGSYVEAQAPVTEKVHWSQANSVIHACMAFGPFIATIHTTLDSGEWAPGKALSPRVLLNVHALPDQPLVSDVLLSDLPVARDEDSLYIVRFGDARLTNGGSAIVLEQVRILEGDGALAHLLENPS